jgi:hypothetical protein
LPAPRQKGGDAAADAAGAGDEVFAFIFHVAIFFGFLCPAIPSVKMKGNIRGRCFALIASGRIFNCTEYGIITRYAGWFDALPQRRDRTPEGV